MPQADPFALLLDHLRCLQAHGQETVLLTRPARRALAALRSGSSARPPAPAPGPATRETVKEKAPSKVAEPPGPSRPAPDRVGRLAEVKSRAENCPRCRALGTLRETFVFSTGSPEADLMFVGEAPGYDEERLGEPFVGKAGQLLDKIIGAMGLQRGDTYISNIVKWRPSTGTDRDQGTANRKPTSEEMEVARTYILEEIQVVEPRVVVALGASAAAGLLGRDDPVGALRSRFHDLEGTPVMVTYHPSYLLRSGSNAEKRKVWEDLLMVMEKLGMPVSDRQRGYFLPKNGSG